MDRVRTVGDEVRDTRTGRTVCVLPRVGVDEPDLIFPADDGWVAVIADGFYLRWFEVASGREEHGRRLLLMDDDAAGLVWVDGSGDDVGSDHSPKLNRWLCCRTMSSRPAGTVNRWLGRLPGLADLADAVDTSRTRLVDGHTGRVVADWPAAREDEFQVTDAGRLLTFNIRDDPRRVVVWDLPPRPSRVWFGSLAAGWAVVVWAAGRAARRRG